ncbi:MAG: SDR family oxidoreductase [Verrucomicrobiae bacterium]|nr:SDR family oxidoreductase [Verrucomicrobiae bacterium]
MKKKVILITGAGKKGSLGHALATHLKQNNFAVAIHYFTHQKDAQKLAKTLPDAKNFGADLTKEKEAKNLINQVIKHYGRLDALINCSGLYHPKTLEKLTEQEWNTDFHSTATTCFFTTRAALPYLRKSKKGRVINLGDSSCQKLTPRNLGISYHIGKTGVLLLTKSFAKQEARYGVTVNMISPGILENSLDLDQTPPIPAGRLGKFEDIFFAIDFLLDEKSQYYTGNNLIASGGWNL